ncbi:lysophospholipid acyltransferase family protein [Myroides ceti]|uniref:Lysophospholipid acyltransferase family protein n=1 Tax=Paenimyroides ceti TaxID=395087 RepID=A0ABT8CQ26_9FLAO|nr:lysophospholipid acyltransferase family protein [Paenimyroides ceti]MDN3705672.1 lysophospholipid acyltransferase family protein [Paenimyroides ceti]MDN3709281.1 lysophospholipid acyltransferase family protein [Paenimyroides ceti]MDN3709868.1 lysophospholipid acyltransferase family protein [Paenimyroides ceti]MDN3710231.1 lysophospholipid acyltransferase family protein [Paenimyroides ceti]
MQKIISYPISIVFYFFFALALLIFHPIQWICLNIFGYQAHKKSVDILNGCLLRCGHILGTTFSVEGVALVPEKVPVIFVSNHQSLYDIVLMIWYLRKAHPKFVSKKELGKGIPSVSFNLKRGGSVLIDRKDSKQALPTIKGLAEYIQKYNRSAVIFPEGTRSKTGAPKSFSENGMKILCKYAPDAYVVPVTINNSWKIFRYGMFPLGLGARVSMKIHEPMKVNDYDFNTLFEITQEKITSQIKY